MKVLPGVPRILKSKCLKDTPPLVKQILYVIYTYILYIIMLIYIYIEYKVKKRPFICFLAVFWAESVANKGIDWCFYTLNSNGYQ